MHIRMINAIIVLTAVISLFFPRITSAQEDLEVEGIMYNENSLAIVNGKIVQEGDRIGGSEVLKIERDCIRFKKDDETFLLSSGQMRSNDSVVKEREAAKRQKEEQKKAKKKEFAEERKRVAGSDLPSLIEQYKKTQEALEDAKDQQERTQEIIRRKMEGAKKSDDEGELWDPEEAQRKEREFWDSIINKK